MARDEKLAKGRPAQAEAQYSIASVSKLTGVSCHALRVWERRYGFPIPRRSAAGHRRYGIDQVRQLRRISELSRGGRSISELVDDLRAGLMATELEPEPGPMGLTVAPSGATELVDRLLVGDQAGADTLFGHLSDGLDPVTVVERLIEPTLIDVGERWFRRECSIFQERCVSNFVRRHLDRLIDQARANNSQPVRTALIGTVQGDRHHGGVLMVSLLLEQFGWRVIELGVDLPTREYQRAAETFRPDALALSFVLSRNINKRFGELAQIQGLPVFVGGRSILNYQGLARRHGLIPVPGPARRAVAQLIAEHSQWLKKP